MEKPSNNLIKRISASFSLINQLALLASVILLLLGIHLHSAFLFVALVPFQLFLFPQRAPFEGISKLIPALFPLFLAVLVWVFILWKQLNIHWLAIPLNFIGYSALLFFTALAWKLGKTTSGYFGLLFFWLGYEYMMLSYMPEFSLPALGNFLAKSHEFIGWFIDTGILGGSAWILIANLFIGIYFRVDLGMTQTRGKLKYIFWFLTTLVLPSIISLFYFKNAQIIYRADAAYATELVSIPVEIGGIATKYAQTGEFLGLIAFWMGIFLILSVFVKDTTRLKNAKRRSSK